MKKIIKLVCLLLVAVCVLLMSGVVYGFYALPDEINSLSDEKLEMGLFYSCSVETKEKNASKNIIAEGEYKLNVKLFNTIPVKNSSLTVSSRPYVVPSGEIAGLRLFAQGVMIVGFEYVVSEKGVVNPAEKANLNKGDVITSIDKTKITSSAQVEKIIMESEGKSLEVEYNTSDGVKKSTTLTPVYSVNEGKYKTGMWIRDSAAGIGTMTFYDKKSGMFACLGHAVCDIDTGEILPLADGDIVDAAVNGCVKGKIGSAGELCGSFRSDSEGILCLNDETGVYGILEEIPQDGKEIPVAAKSEVKTGKAHIISTVDGEGKAYYEIEIEKLNPDGKDSKNMIIKITDNKLLEKTGGIVQGMSGSPIIQNGRLVGAVTHVFVNDPTRGYGIFAETMLESVRQISVSDYVTDKCS